MTEVRAFSVSYTKPWSQRSLTSAAISWAEASWLASMANSSGWIKAVLA